MAPADSLNPDLPPSRVLVVEDSEELRVIVSAFLMRRGFTVLQADSAESALIQAACQSLDGVLTDVEMPGVNGFELCRKLRCLDATLGRTVPVWIMTGSGAPQLEADALAAGARGVFRKPFDGRVVAGALYDALVATKVEELARSDGN